MKSSITLLALLALSSCAIGKKMRLKHFDYEIGSIAKLSVNSLTHSEKKLGFKLLGISLGEEIVGFKREDIQCGVGKTRLDEVSVSEEFIVMPKTSYKEFQINCNSQVPLNSGQKPFLFIKDLYSVRNELPHEVLKSNVRIEFN